MQCILDNQPHRGGTTCDCTLLDMDTGGNEASSKRPLLEEAEQFWSQILFGWQWRLQHGSGAAFSDTARIPESH